MTQFIWNKKTNQVMAKTLWAISEFMNEEIVWMEDVLSEIPEEFYDDVDAVEIFCLNKWFDIKTNGILEGDMKFIRSEKEIIE